jgi:deazaflavin-dependent oxidoreductase (nitroreductase family)
MPFPGWLARFNRRATNRATLGFAGRAPGFAIVTHVGRSSGTLYRTPVNLFRADGTYVIALTYGSDRDWVKNVMVAGGCVVETRGEVVRLEDPRIVTDAKAGLAAAGVRPILRATNVTEFMLLRPAALERPPSTAEQRPPSKSERRPPRKTEERPTERRRAAAS